MRKKVICAPLSLIPSNLEKDTSYFATYAIPQQSNIGYFGSTLPKDIVKAGLAPNEIAWDFLTIALSVASADEAISRNKSEDGWTRQIDLQIHLAEPAYWQPCKDQIEQTLRFLTGDYWYLSFYPNGIKPPENKKKHVFYNDCVMLLSGGLDSLIGAIDFVESGKRPIFVSQKVRGEVEHQLLFAKTILPNTPYMQWNHNINRPSKEGEPSTRARSIVFLAYAAIVASAIKQIDRVPIIVPENGFISLNVSLNSARQSSLSTKTTHPIYLSGIQSTWEKLGLNIQIQTPYKFKTKGEMISECKNKSLLQKLLGKTVSCGKYLRYNRTHCGRCLPCLVRRSALFHAGIPDIPERGYRFNLLDGRCKDGADDIGAILYACENIRKNGIRSQILGALSFAPPESRQLYQNMLENGYKELRTYLEKEGML